MPNKATAMLCHVEWANLNALAELWLTVEGGLVKPWRPDVAHVSVCLSVCRWTIGCVNVTSHELDDLSPCLHLVG